MKSAIQVTGAPLLELSDLDQANLAFFLIQNPNVNTNRMAYYATATTVQEYLTTYLRGDKSLRAITLSNTILDSFSNPNPFISIVNYSIVEYPSLPDLSKIGLNYTGICTLSHYFQYDTPLNIIQTLSFTNGISFIRYTDTSSVNTVIITPAVTDPDTGAVITPAVTEEVKYWHPWQLVNNSIGALSSGLKKIDPDNYLGWLELAGTSYLKTSYPQLYSFLVDCQIIQATPDTEVSFTLPDLRGNYARFYETGTSLRNKLWKSTNKPGDMSDWTFPESTGSFNGVCTTDANTPETGIVSGAFSFVPSLQTLAPGTYQVGNSPLLKFNLSGGVEGITEINVGPEVSVNSVYVVPYIFAGYPQSSSSGG